MEVIVTKSSGFPTEELRQAVQRICTRAQALFPNTHLKVGEDFNDVECAATYNNNGRLWIEERKGIFKLVQRYLFTAPKDLYYGGYLCFAQCPEVLQIVREEMERFCTEIGVEKLTIEET
jgi:hypothetical protein